MKSAMRLQHSPGLSLKQSSLSVSRRGVSVLGGGGSGIPENQKTNNKRQREMVSLAKRNERNFLFRSI